MQTLHFVEDSFRNLLNYPVTTSECCKRGTEENLGFPKHASGERWNSGILQSTKTLWMDFVCVCLIKLWMLNTAKKKKKRRRKKCWVVWFQILPSSTSTLFPLMNSTHKKGQQNPLLNFLETTYLAAFQELDLSVPLPIPLVKLKCLYIVCISVNKVLYIWLEKCQLQWFWFRILVIYSSVNFIHKNYENYINVRQRPFFHD